MTLRRLWSVLPLALPLLAGLLAPLSTIDLAYQLRLGDLIVAGRAIPATDSFTFTAFGLPWLDQQWLAQVLFAALFGLGGWEGLVLVHALLLASIGGLLYWIVRERGVAEPISAVVAIVAFIVAAPALGMRPQLLGVVLFAATLAALGARARHPRLIWVVPVLAVIWANVHGSFVFALAAMAWALLEDVVARDHRVRQTAAVLAVTAIATCLTPFGPGVWRYVVELSADPRIRQLVSEWRPTDPLSATGFLVIASGALVALIVVARWRAGLRASPPTLLWLAGLFALALAQQRAIPWWAIGSVAGIAPFLPQDVPVPEQRRRGAAAIAALLVVAIVAGLPWWRSIPLGAQALLGDAPGQLTSFLASATRPGDRIRNPQEWGSWFEQALPGRLVSVDSRIELFPAATWSDDRLLARGEPGWESVLSQWTPAVVVVSKLDEPGLLAVLSDDRAWHGIYDDAVSAVFARTSESFTLTRASHATIGIITIGRFINE